MYIRVSRLGERDEQEATEAYEAQCRAWAASNGVAVDEVVEDTDVSGAAAVAERGLERLIQRVESGESDGILTPYLDRFGRDLIEGAVAYKRIAEAGGRLVAVSNGLDSANPGSEMSFHMLLVVAQGELSRHKANWNVANERMIEKGLWPAPRIPFGYRKSEETRKLVVEKAEAAVVRELFRRRAKGENYMRLMRWMRSRCEREGMRGAKVTRTGVRSILANEVYLGVTKYPRSRKDHPLVKVTHRPIVTEKRWEAAQIKEEFSPRNGRASTARLRGLVFCATCGRRCKVGASPRKSGKVPTYLCTNLECPAHAAMLAEILDPYVEGLLMDAAADREPQVEAIILGDTRYRDAMQAVQEARQAYEEFRDSGELQRQLGVRDFAAGLDARKEALVLARRELSRVRPASKRAEPRERFAADEEAEAFVAAQNTARFVARVVLRPNGEGPRRSADERAEVYFHGADEPYEPPYYDPADWPEGVSPVPSPPYRPPKSG